jgi:hypothetical protein
MAENWELPDFTLKSHSPKVANRNRRYFSVDELM